MKDLTEENRLLRDRLAALTEEAAKNESILRRTQERELQLLKAESLSDLFKVVVDGLSDSYGLHAVTLIFCDPHHEVRHLLMSAGVDVSEFPGVMLVDSIAGLAPQFSSLRKPWLGPHIGADHQLVFPGISNLGSVALIPLLRQEVLIGSLNFGSSDPQRFTRHHASDFLNHLGVILAFCLENAVNRARLVRSGITDVLTGWHNRRYLETRMREELARAQRAGNNLICLMLDLDHFKRINDRFGHLAGDAVLREVAQRIEYQVRISDVAARYGGEEFVVLLPATELPVAVNIAERIRAAVSSSPIEIREGHAATMTVSIGVAAVQPKPKQNDLKTIGESLLAQADVALYRAKSEGRDRVVTA